MIPELLALAGEVAISYYTPNKQDDVVAARKVLKAVSLFLAKLMGKQQGLAYRLASQAQKLSKESDKAGDQAQELLKLLETVDIGL